MPTVKGNENGFGEPRVYLIDFLKAILSLLIVLHHYSHLKSFAGVSVPENWLLQAVFEFGSLAVEFFFLLSGFLAVFLHRRLPTEKKLSAQRTCFAKLKKWYPAYFVSTTICLFLQATAWTRSGEMLLGLANYHLFDIVGNFLMIQCSIFSLRSNLNVPLWFLTPLLVCHLVLAVVERKFRKNTVVAYSVLAIVGGIAIYYNWQYPVFNWMMGRGFYGFFIGAIVGSLYDAFDLKISGKILLGISVILTMVFTKKGYAGNLYLTVTVCFAMLLLLMLKIPVMEKFFSHKAIRKIYEPFYRISYEVFCSHYVVLTGIALLGRISEGYPYSIGGYVLLSYILAIVLKKCAKVLVRCFVSLPNS